MPESIGPDLLHGISVRDQAGVSRSTVLKRRRVVFRRIVSYEAALRPAPIWIISLALPPRASWCHRIGGITRLGQDFKTKSGTVRITDSSVFPASTTTAAALVAVAPGGMRELHWHPNVDEWQYYIEGEGRMGVFGASGQARTFDFHAGDVGYVPFAMGHYIENRGTTPLRFLEMFRSSYYADVSLDQWMALTPPEVVSAHLKLNPEVMEALRKNKVPVVPA
jgi:oxalate decarboxylase family bicupin protein